MATAIPVDMPKVQQSNTINPEQLKIMEKIERDSYKRGYLYACSMEKIERDSYKRGYLDACSDNCKDGVVEVGLQRTSTKPYVKYNRGGGKLSKKVKTKSKKKKPKKTKNKKKRTKKKRV